MSQSTTSVQPQTRSRYGDRGSEGTPFRSSFKGRIVIILGAIFIIMGLVLTGFYINRLSKQSSGISATVTNNARLSDHEIKIEFDVIRDDTSVDSVCIVTAKNFDMTEVGRREVLVPAGGPEAQRLSAVIRTDDLPVSADVYGCSTTVLDYLTQTPA